MTHRVIYVGGPYTHADHNVRSARFDALTAVAADLVRRGHIVYSPITHTHPIDVLFVRDDVHLSSDFWCDFDETFMSVCTEMVIVPLDGWEKSGGVKREREYFERRKLPVLLWDDWRAREFAKTAYKAAGGGAEQAA
jgi:hypothetical protein